MSDHLRIYENYCISLKRNGERDFKRIAFETTCAAISREMGITITAAGEHLNGLRCAASEVNAS